MDNAKLTYKFKLDQSAPLRPASFNRDGARGAYKVTKQLPERNGEFEYQIKSSGEPRPRVVLRIQIRLLRMMLSTASADVQWTNLVGFSGFA